MKELFLVGVGSFVGGIGRYSCSGLLLHQFPNAKLPVATLVVNIVGCLLIGVIGGLAEKMHVISPEARLMIITGILGGFTTFSAFGFETIFLVRRGELGIAATYVLLSVVVGLAAVFLGDALVPHG